MTRYLLLMIAVAALLMGCTGDEPTEADKTPPWKPDLFEHLGDAGDGMMAQPIVIDYPEGPMYYQVELNDQNNGIDAVPGGDWIRLQWAPLTDNDIDFIRIYRYPNTTSAPQPVLIDSVSFIEQISYIDESLDQTDVGNEWFYFIDVFDRAGNHTVSDTVSYQLITKPLLTYPADGSVFSADDEITFQWNILTTDSVSLYRLLVMRDDGAEEPAMIWWYDETDTDPQEYYLTKTYDGAELTPGDYFWRVDPIINGVGLDSGSESRYMQFTIE